jgi:histidinol dehydrogenase
MQIIKNPNTEQWKALTARPIKNMAEIEERVRPILQNVKNRGDEALREHALQFDNIILNDLAMPAEYQANARANISKQLADALEVAYKNIYKFHESQLHQEPIVETSPGVQCWRQSKGIQRVGLYVPGGSAPLFSTVLMLGIPAQLAGCERVVLCTPSNHPAILYAAQLCGITEIYRLGGAQAIAALAYGTESVPQVYKIFGPGNQYVTAAKMLVNAEGIAIDMPAGPSEVAILADASSNPAFVAADLLSQAEHGADSQVLLVSTQLTVIEAVMKEIVLQTDLLPRANLIKETLKNSRFVLLETEEKAIDFLNEYAAEHLILATDKADVLLPKIKNAGSIFLGHYTPEAAGDYASGTNHTLPTYGYAKAYSGVSVDSFVKKITVQKISQQGIKTLGPIVETMAENEELLAHKNAVSIRLAHINQ